ncbi:MAG: sulfotransferase family protein [Acidocella sp. 20-61-6]|nr:MAG: sulfotransferase family protein [Acidocella sp. 20-61-6]
MAVLYQALGSGFRLADRIVPQALLPGLGPAGLVRAAKVSPGADAVAGLDALTTALAADTKLTLFGRLSLRWDAIRLLRNAQAVERAHAVNPALAAAPVAAPIFILGLPRSGTSFLHSLLAEDTENLVPRAWQTIYPAPRPAEFRPETDRRVRSVDQQLKLFADLAPGFAELHPITGDSPQECSEITAHVFQSLRFDTTFRVPGYLAWLEARGHADAFAFHRRFLQFLQDGVASRWVLKCPDHTFCVDDILAVYPDARFVVVHRDPVEVLGSNARLTAALRKPFLRNIDLAEIGAQEAARWTEGANRLLDFDRRPDVPAARKIHVHYRDVTGAPIETARRMYEGFGLALRPEAEAAMQRLLDAKPRGGYAKHAPYSLDPFRISLSALREGFAPYVRRYC